MCCWVRETVCVSCQSFFSISFSSLSAPYRCLSIGLLCPLLGRLQCVCACMRVCARIVVAGSRQPWGVFEQGRSTEALFILRGVKPDDRAPFFSHLSICPSVSPVFWQLFARMLAPHRRLFPPPLFSALFSFLFFFVCFSVCVACRLLAALADGLSPCCQSALGSGHQYARYSASKLPEDEARMDRISTFERGGGFFCGSPVYMFLFLMLSFPHGCTFPCIHPSVSVQLHKGFFFFWLLVWRSLLPPLASFWLLNKHTCTHTVIWYESGYKGQSPRCYCKLAYLKKVQGFGLSLNKD